MKPNTKQYRIATALYNQSEPKTAGELAGETGVKRGTVDSSLSNLQDNAYVDRKGDGGRADPYRYELTDKGRHDMKSREDNGGLNQLFDDPNVPGTADENTADADENTADTPANATTNGDVTFTASVDEVADILIALGAADEPGPERRHRVAVLVASSLMGGK